MSEAEPPVVLQTQLSPAPPVPSSTVSPCQQVVEFDVLMARPQPAKGVAPRATGQNAASQTGAVVDMLI